MCRRFAIDLDWDDIAERFGVTDMQSDRLPNHTWRVEPTQTIGLLAQSSDGVRHLSPAYWSLVPRWEPSKTLSYPTYNARIESAHVKPTYSESTTSMRAIIPASGYYEWKGRRPFYFHGRDDKPLFMAGLYSWWRAGPAFPFALTATIITMNAVQGPDAVHDRMPVLVPANMADDWLDPARVGASMLRSLADAGGKLSAALDFHEVAPLNGDGPRLIAPLSRETPLSLFD